ncbi:hypothetical protein WCLP8_3860003 [uncultured Gammaproteobacteria bacterium]
MTAALPARVQAALACLDQPGVLEPRLQLLVTTSGRRVVIKLENGLWRILEQVAAAHGIPPVALCRQVLDAAPFVPPADAVASFLIQFLGERAAPCANSR